MHSRWIKEPWEEGDPRSRTRSYRLRGSSTAFCNPLMRLCQSSLASLPCATWNTAHGESWWSHFLSHKTLQTYLYYFPCMPVMGCLPSPHHPDSQMFGKHRLFSPECNFVDGYILKYYALVKPSNDCFSLLTSQFSGSRLRKPTWKPELSVTT